MSRQSWSRTICALLQQAMDCQPTIEQMATMINVTPRTLNRRLAREGTTYRDLALQVRNRRAREMLAEGKLTVSQVAYTLGYTDLANFSRSFKKACGITPSTYRSARQEVSRESTQIDQRNQLQFF